MMFDNSPVPRPSRWAIVKDHLPLIILVFAAVGVAAGLHLASAVIAIAAAGHVVVFAAVFAIAGWRKRTARAAQR